MINKSPVGLWRTFDLKNNARSIVRFYQVDNEFRADVVKILINVGERCNKCRGELKNKPYLGMTIIQGLKAKGNNWANGQVLDTDSGNTYSCSISLSEDGNTMYFHAFKGLPLFGRTVVWKRDE